MLSNFPKVRLGLYFLALASQVASIFAPVWIPELAAPFKETSDYLGVIALGTAVSNTNFAAPRSTGYTSSGVIAAPGAFGTVDGKHEA